MALGRGISVCWRGGRGWAGASIEEAFLLEDELHVDVASSGVLLHLRLDEEGLVGRVDQHFEAVPRMNDVDSGRAVIFLMRLLHLKRLGVDSAHLAVKITGDRLLVEVDTNLLTRLVHAHVDEQGTRGLVGTVTMGRENRTLAAGMNRLVGRHDELLFVQN